jgi:carboxyl-terminal processing protease
MASQSANCKTQAALILLAVLLGAVLGLGAFQPLRAWLDSRHPQPEPSPIGLQTVTEVLDLLQEDYIRSLDTRELLEGALTGMRAFLEKKGIQGVELPELPQTQDRARLQEEFTRRFLEAQVAPGIEIPELSYAALTGLVEAVNDPYTTVMDPEQYRRLSEQMSGGNFGGVGIYLESDPRHEGRLTVIEPIENSPAAAAGIRTGDWITHIDGEDTSEFDIEAATLKIRGEVGTRVVLTLKRGTLPPFDVTLQRQQIHVSSTTPKMLPDQIGYLRIRFFGEDTGREFQADLDELLQQGARALVLDVRNNGGGYISAALDVVSHFVDKGSVVVSVVNPRLERNESHRADAQKKVQLPVVLLMNRFSASASEITAGALKDLGVAVLVGETTFGKASVQSLHELSDGGALRHTIAHYLTPNGRDIHRQGIEPDVVVEAEPSNKLGGAQDAQLKAAVQQLYKLLAQARARNP